MSAIFDFYKSMQEMENSLKEIASQNNDLQGVVSEGRRFIRNTRYVDKLREKLTLEESCKLMGLKYINIDELSTLVSIIWPNGDHNALLVSEDCGDGDYDVWIMRRFNSIHFCHECSEKKHTLMAEVAKIAATNGISTVFSSIGEKFIIEDVQFEDYEKFPVFWQLKDKYGEEFAREIWDKISIQDRR